MFTPIAPEIVETMKTHGIIRFFVFKGWEFIAAHGSFTTIPHKIVYMKKIEKADTDYTEIFNCTLTLDKYAFILENISAASPIPLSKAAEYMFLEMTVEAAEDLAKLSKKERLMITTNLSTFSEIASEHNFIIEKNRDDFGNVLKAMKILEYKGKGVYKNEESN